MRLSWTRTGRGIPTSAHKPFHVAQQMASAHSRKTGTCRSCAPRRKGKWDQKETASLWHIWSLKNNGDPVIIQHILITYSVPVTVL